MTTDLDWTAPTATFDADEDKWSRFSSRWWADGLYPSSEGTSNFEPNVAATGGLAVHIGSGDVIIDGFSAYLSQITRVELPSADPNNPRIDRIVLGLSTSPPAAKISIFPITGDASQNPVAPGLLATQVPICRVLVPALSGTVLPTHISDERQWMRLRLLGSVTPTAIGREAASTGGSYTAAAGDHRHALDPAGAAAVVLPAGVTLAWPSATLPSGGWLWANGQAVSRATYPELFANIGTTWGAGNGTTTFNVPNITGKFISGAGGSRAVLGSGGGQDSWTLTVAQMPAHRHGLGGDEGFRWVGSTPSTLRLATSGTGTEVSITNHDLKGGGASHPTLPIYVAMNHIVKAH